MVGCGSEEGKLKNVDFHFVLHLPFTTFIEGRLRFGIAKLKKIIFHFALLSPCTTFAKVQIK